MKYNYYQSDSHLQEYAYDEDNRLTKVRTSRYGYLWDQDATYQYFPHGPLKRIALGHDLLQGIDYSYTIQGWLKAINHVEITDNISTSKDPGRDGIPTVIGSPSCPTTAYDGFSEILNYFNGDYVHQVGNFTSSTRLTDANLSISSLTFAPLYNGNIASIENNYMLGSNNSINFDKQLDFTYKYDYINRLRESKTMFRTNNSSPAVWTAPSVPPGSPNDYNTAYNYDPNGNIKHLGRAKNGIGVDNLTYNYTPGTNQLTNINDNPANDNLFNDDIDDQPSGAYTYDASGNQIKDVGGVDKINWTVDGKVKSVANSTMQIANYVYDASGNRVMKHTPVMNTIYARDANSQVMAIYESGNFDPSIGGDPSVTQCLELVYTQNNQTYVCTFEFEICGNYTYDVQTGEITLTQPVTSKPIISGPCQGIFQTLAIGTKLKIDVNQLLGTSSTMSLLTIDGIDKSGTLNHKFTVSDISLMPKLSEWHIYGNEQQGRFSVRKPDEENLYYLDLLTDDVNKKNFKRILDKKQYELKDHLGNVRVAIGDMKIPTTPTVTRGTPPFNVDEKSVSDFYPGGMSISDRSWQGTSYRYGYNGQEKSLEIDASGNHNTAEFWEVDNARLGRWNTDPVVKAHQSGYSIFGNNPILYNDLFGNTETVSIPSGGGSIEYKTTPNGEGKSILFSTNSGIIDASRSALFNDISMQRDNATISQTPFNLFTQIQNDITTLNNSKFWTSKAIGFLFDIPFSFANSASLLFGGKYLNGNVPSEAKAFQDAGVNVMSTLFLSASGGGSNSAVKVLETEVVEVEAVGQIHHLLSNKIVDALDNHPTLNGLFDRKNLEFIYKAIDADAHKGYQTWHRQYDNIVIDWIKAPFNGNANQRQFIEYLNNLYQEPWLRERIPNVNLLRK